MGNIDLADTVETHIGLDTVVAQKFSTGSNAGGYTLTRIGIRFSTAVGTPANLRAELWSSGSDGNPGAKLASLRVPSSVPNGIVFFAAPENTVLREGDSYFAVVYRSAATTGGLGLEAVYKEEETGGARGWSIGNEQHSRTSINSGSWSTSGNIMKIRVYGYANRPAPGAAPSFREDPLPWSATLRVTDTAPSLGSSGNAVRKKKSGGSYIACTDNSGLASNEWCSSGQVYERVPRSSIASNLAYGLYGCRDNAGGESCSPGENLTDNYFSYGGTGYRVTAVTLTAGALSFSLDKPIPEGLKTASLRVGTKWLSLADAASVKGVTAQWGDTGLDWVPGNNIALRLDTTVQGGEGPSGPGATQHSGELTASFEEVPEEHDGTGFAFLVRFSEVLGASYSRTLRKKSFSVSGGRVKKVKQVDAGLWRVRVAPRSWKRDVSVTLAGGRDCDADGAVCTPDGRELANTLRASVRGPVRIEVKGGKALEGRDTEIAFVVTLSRAASAEVTVDYTTEAEYGTATAGEDYAETSGTLTFAVGETEKTVSVEILDDEVDEDRENFKLTLSDARGAYILDDEATGRILNDDPSP